MSAAHLNWLADMVAQSPSEARWLEELSGRIGCDAVRRAATPEKVEGFSTQLAAPVPAGGFLIALRRDKRRFKPSDRGLLRAVAAVLHTDSDAPADKILRLLVNQMPAIVWTTDRELHLRHSMGAGLEVLGVQEDPTFNPTLYEYFGTEDPEYMPVQAHLRALKGESVRYIMPWGAGCWQTRVEPLLDSQGRIVGTVGVAFDITEQQRLQDELEGMVRARTAELEGANERLKELDRFKSEFMATMSHELRTPLNTILGFTDVLLQGMLGPMKDEHVRPLTFVHAAARHLLSLINAILDISRIESGHMNVSSEPMVVEDMVAEVAESLEPLAAKKGLEFRLDRQGKWHEVFSDRQKVYQILLNLAGNAVKFTDTGAVTITVESLDFGVRVNVRDTGPGLTPEQQSQLWQAFRPLRMETGEKSMGTGLGLFLSQRLVTLLGGTMGFETQFGAGSTFWFTLPWRYGVGGGEASVTTS